MITLSLTSYNRPEYLQQTLNSLAQTDFGYDRLEIFCFDDNSDDFRTVQLLRRFKHPNLRVNLSFRDKRLGCDANNFTALRYLFNRGEKYVFVIDSDGICKKNWYKFLTRKIKEYPNLGGLSLFNAMPASYISKHDDELNEVKSFGGFASLINGEAFRGLNLEKSWDLDFCEYARNRGYQILCSNKSYFQHIGEFGEHSSDKWCIKANNYVD